MTLGKRRRILRTPIPSSQRPCTVPCSQHRWMFTWTAMSPFKPFLAAHGFVALDGGLATEMEAQGAKLDEHLWSASLLYDNPALIRATHLAYYRAGADVATTASYQASFEGFLRKGFDREKSIELFLLSVDLANQAREHFWQEYQEEEQRRLCVASEPQKAESSQLAIDKYAKEPIQRNPVLGSGNGAHSDSASTPRSPSSSSTPAQTSTRIETATATGGAASTSVLSRPETAEVLCTVRHEKHRVANDVCREQSLIFCRRDDPHREGHRPMRQERLRPLVAVSLGCYGAALADGSEYRGDYGARLGMVAMREWHKERLDVVAGADGVDLVMFETIPCLEEVRAVLSLIEGYERSINAVITVSCKDEKHLRSGELVQDFARLIWGQAPSENVIMHNSGASPPPTKQPPPADTTTIDPQTSKLSSHFSVKGSAKIVGVGVNCTAPEHVSGVLKTLGDAKIARKQLNIGNQMRIADREDANTASDRCILIESGRRLDDAALVACPNSGETWNAITLDWAEGTGFRGDGGAREFGKMSVEWCRAGAVVVGGCCRTTPLHIEAMTSALRSKGEKMRLKVLQQRYDQYGVSLG